MTQTPEPDRMEGAPHPRDTHRLIGQETAEAEFLAAQRAGRAHHGWLLTGPKGIGKATLAWRIARYLLAAEDRAALSADGPGLFGDAPPTALPAADSLDIAPDHPVARRMVAGAEPRLFVLRRPWDEKAARLRAEITVDEVRRLKSFFTLSAADGGARVAIVDAADEMNGAAANALLKLLEEPPAGATLLLIAHQPGRLLPTIRSRCRTLRLGLLQPAQVQEALGAALAAEGGDTSDLTPATLAAVAALSGGSVGAAIGLAVQDGAARYGEVLQLAQGMPGVDRQVVQALAESCAGRGAEARLDLMVTLFETLLGRIARCGVLGPPTPEAIPGEAAILTRLAPDATASRIWADLAQTQIARLRAGRAVNLDPAALLVDMVLKLDAAAQGTAQR